MRYRHLRGKSEYWPFEARVTRRRRQKRGAGSLRAAALLCVLLALLLWLRQAVGTAQPQLPAAGSQPVSQAAQAAESQAQAAATPDPLFSVPQVLPLYARLYAKNPDLVGWLSIEGTPINYPVLQTPGDNEYYLRRGFDRLFSGGGSLFLDERCSTTAPTDNLLIYGHNMHDGSMFAALTQYRDKAFWQEHSTLRFDTLYREGSWQIIAVVETTLDSGLDHPYYTFFDARDAADWQLYYDRLTACALYDTGLAAAYGDELLTLSTCSEWQGGNGRLGVVAKRMEEPS